MDINDPATVALIWALLTSAIISATLVLLVVPRSVRFAGKFVTVLRMQRRVKRLRPNWTREQRRAFLGALAAGSPMRHAFLVHDVRAWERAEAKRARKATKGTASRLPVKGSL